MRGLFLTGTDTGVGKTYVACALLRELRAAGIVAGAYKPACSGAIVLPDGQPEWEDVTALAQATDGRFPPDRIGPQRFLAPLAPPAAAAEEGRAVDSALLLTGRDWWTGQVEWLLVEGAGGLLSPLAAGVSNADLAQQLGYPLLIVAADRLGMINHTLLTVEAALARGLSVLGVLLNRIAPVADSSTASNGIQLARVCPVPVLGLWPYAAKQALRPGGSGETIDWPTLLGA